jgi:hypothetical protein
MCSRAKIALDAQSPIGRQQRPTKEDLLADRRCHGQHDDFVARQGAQQGSQVAVQGSPPLKTVRGEPRREHESQPDQQPGNDAKQDLRVFPPAHAPHARVSAQGRPSDAGRG